jgi:glycosyltransferase involved in cell wall biosynthesis
MIKTPLVSILVGFFNSEQFIEETIVSVFSQTLDDWELILVDDGSSDGSSAIAQHYAAENPGKVRYFTHEGHRNRGVCASRNLALRQARGQFIAILDADDVWLPKKLAEQVEVLEEHPQVGMVFGAARYWREWTAAATGSGGDYTPALGVEIDTIHEPPSLLRRCHPLGRAIAPSPSDLLLRKEVLLKVNGFEEEFNGIYQMYEDQAFLAKVYVSTPVFASARTWTLYRLHEGSCCYRVEASGEERKVRVFYLNWLDYYLREWKVQDKRIQRALNRASTLARYRWIYALANAPSKIKRIVKNAIMLPQ